jgi:predicted nucleic acid-binding protein
MKLFLPDTNVLIYGFSNIAPFGEYLKQWIREKTLALSAIVVAEFLVDISKKDKEMFEMLLEEFGSLPVDTSVARIAADYRKSFLQKGYKLKLPDCLIAATAKLSDATLVSLNLKDFPMKDIEKLEL